VSFMSFMSFVTFKTVEELNVFPDLVRVPFAIIASLFIEICKVIFTYESNPFMYGNIFCCPCSLKM